MRGDLIGQQCMEKLRSPAFQGLGSMLGRIRASYYREEASCTSFVSLVLMGTCLAPCRLDHDSWQDRRRLRWRRPANLRTSRVPAYPAVGHVRDWVSGCRPMHKAFLANRRPRACRDLVRERARQACPSRTRTTLFSWHWTDALTSQRGRCFPMPSPRLSPVIGGKSEPCPVYLDGSTAFGAGGSERIGSVCWTPFFGTEMTIHYPRGIVVEGQVAVGDSRSVLVGWRGRLGRVGSTSSVVELDLPLPWSTSEETSF